MNTSKFQPQSFKTEFPHLKYLPELDHSFPVPNEILECMECFVSSSKKENDEKGKNHFNLSEIGFKIILTMLSLRNPFQKAPMTIKNIEYYCRGYSEKSIREAAKWLAKKGLLLRRKGKYDRDEFLINYTGLSYSEIVEDINKQRENCIPLGEIVFKGIRELTTPEFKKDGDGKHTDNFTLIQYFLPKAKRIEINGELDWEYEKNPLFDSLDGNTLKVILKMAYLQHYNIFRSNNPLTPIKIETLMKRCGVSRNKIIQSIKYLELGGFLRSYKGENKRKCKRYIFNFRSFRKMKIQPELKRRNERELKKKTVLENEREKSFPVSGLHNIETISILEYQNTNPFPSRDDYNKNLNLNKIQESFKKDESMRYNFSLNNSEEKEKKYQSLKTELSQDQENKKITWLEYIAYNTHLEKRRKLGEELYSKDELIKSYLETLSIEKRNSEERELVNI